MAKTENLLQGRLGNLIFYQVKGVTWIRSVPLMVRNPETPAHQAVRKHLIVSVQFYRRLKDTPLKAVWQVAARDTLVNGYNLFLKRNIHAFNDRTLSTPSALSMTCGNLPRMNDLRMTGRSDRTVTLAWNNSLEADGRTAADRLQVVALFDQRMYSPVWLKGVQACRGDRKAVIDLEQENFHQAHLYCFFRSPDGGAFSASAYVCVPGNGGQKVPEV